MACIEEMLSNEKGTLREYLLKLLLKEELITEGTACKWKYVWL